MTRITRRQFGAGSLTTLMVTGIAGAGRAQSWPSQPVHVVVPFGPGGSTDAVTRPVTDRLTQVLGTPFVVDNMGGAGSVIGTTAVASAEPDGYTLLSSTASFVTAPLVQNTTYQPTEFEPVALLARSPYLVIVPASSPAQTLDDLIQMAKDEPDGLFYATAGIGSSTHFASEYFNMRAGTTMQHVPYDGIGSAMLGILGGDVQMIITTNPSAAAQIADGSVRVLAYTAEGKPAEAPDAPTVAEASGMDYEVASWWAMFAPPGTPREIREQLNQAINEILQTPEIAEIYNTQGTNPAPMELDELEQMVATETDRWREVADFAEMTAN